MTNAVQVQISEGMLVSLRANNGENTEIAAGDGFAAIFQNMASLAQQVPETMTGAGEAAQKKNQQTLMEQLAAMLLANPALAQYLPDASKENVAVESSQLLEALGQTATASAQGLTQILAQLANTSTLQQQGAGKGTNNELTQLFALLNGAEVAKEGTGEIPVTQVATGSGFAQGGQQGSMEQLFSAQQQIRSAVNAVKEGTVKGEKRLEQELNVDQLQGQVNLNRFDSMQVVKLQTVGTPESTEEPQLLTQLTNGIPPKLTKGEGEFVMKLNPDSLGEITVRFMEKDGKTAVTIFTANNQTAKLINGEIAALRDALRPMQVEVRDAILETAQTPQGQMRFDMAGQQFSDRQQAFEDAKGNPVYYAHTQEEQAQVEQAQPLPQQELANSMLNIRI